MKIIQKPARVLMYLLFASALVFHHQFSQISDPPAS